jgi:hypothetical protein
MYRLFFYRFVGNEGIMRQLSFWQLVLIVEGQGLFASKHSVLKHIWNGTKKINRFTINT